MRTGKSTKKIFSTITLMVYIFVFFFAQNFHTHKVSDFFKDLKIPSTEHSLKKSESFQNFDSCLSCHFVHEGHGLISDIPDWNYKAVSVFRELTYSFKPVYTNSPVRALSLRGPPFSV